MPLGTLYWGNVLEKGAKTAKLSKCAIDKLKAKRCAEIKQSNIRKFAMLFFLLTFHFLDGKTFDNFVYMFICLSRQNMKGFEISFSTVEIFVCHLLKYQMP